MLEQLDMRTLLMSGALVCLTLAGVMLYYSFTRKTYPGFHYWTVGTVGIGVGGLLVAMRNFIPDFATIIIGNTLIVVMPFFLAQGLAVFLGIKWRHPALNYVLFAAFVLIFLHATYIQPDLETRILCISSVLVIFFTQSLYLVVKYLPQTLGEQNWFLIIVLSMTIASNLLRIILAISSTGKLTFMVNSGLIQCMVAIAMTIGVVGTTSSLLILNSQRLENALKKANRRIEKLADQDGLTGLFNRRYFDRKLNQEFNRLQRSAQPISLILADIDCFKMYNDTYGHQAGDDCLKTIAGVFKNAGGRAADVAARYGGEEFVILLPNTDLKGARKVAETMKQAVEQLAIPHTASDPENVITLSFGVAEVIPDMSLSPDTLVAQADLALYKSKANGKNQIHTQTGPVVEGQSPKKPMGVV